MRKKNTQRFCFKLEIEIISRRKILNIRRWIKKKLNHTISIKLLWLDAPSSLVSDSMFIVSGKIRFQKLFKKNKKSHSHLLIAQNWTIRFYRKIHRSMQNLLRFWVLFFVISEKFVFKSYTQKSKIFDKNNVKTLL